MDLITLEEYKAYAGISSTNQDSEIEVIIPIVSKFVKTYCRSGLVDFVNDAKIEYFNGGNPEILLSEYPIISVLGVEYSEDYGQTTTDLVEYTDFVLDLENNKILPLPVSSTDNLTVFPKLINGYKVSYYAGYETLPEDLKVAVFDLVTYYLKNDGSVHSPKAPGTNSVQIEYITSTALPAHIARILNLYKLSWD